MKYPMSAFILTAVHVLVSGQALGEAACEVSLDASCILQKKVQSKEAEVVEDIAAPQAEDQADPDGSANHCLDNNGMHLRIRKNIFDYSVTDWNRFKDALISLQKRGAYDKYPYEHTKHYNDETEDGTQIEWADHNGALSFLPFHRSHIQDLETELQVEAGSCDLTFPYWNWAANQNLLDSDVWTDSYMGNADGCVTTGLVADWTYPYNAAQTEFKDWPEHAQTDAAKETRGCLERKVSASNCNKRGTRCMKTVQQLGEIVQEYDKYGEFCVELESIHGLVHGLIGGNMAGKIGRGSPSDPMFYLHHEFIDSLWYKWQVLRFRTAEPTDPKKWRPNNRHDPEWKADIRKDLRIWAGIYNEENNCVWLPINVAHGQGSWNNVKKSCVRYKDTKNINAPGQGQVLAQKGESKCSALQRQISNGECSLAELKAIPCLVSTHCGEDLQGEEEASSAFVNDAAQDQVFDNLLELEYEEDRCRKFTHGFAEEEEEELCFNCSVVCKDGPALLNTTTS